ncbi:hypothetical protein H6P81_000695 [Aristolochia fimbriata]|uniref:Telomere-associated protein Rif1 N-terminal domain-containing protein n=1 Tax=Aristolochia fimbriata TaxID=158543 RepID=A0AAV7F4Z9_ARIFI|nr:hypothetical protein H6P81_000695 [Aristolochia fimbriata]
MSDSTRRVEDVSSMLLQSKSREDKSFAYSTLLHIQEESVGESSIIESLTRRSHRLLSIILLDIFHDEEEIATQALKCLGFMIYHPSIVSTISGEEVFHAIKSLVKLITTTNMKAICNLGVWCISIQQFKNSFNIDILDSLLRAVVHAFDNPLGSLSTTYEAMQAVLKLASEHPESMRNMSNMWAPPIYQRLLSDDKRERDMSERCLIKMKSFLLPPPLILSQDLAYNIKKKFLPQMMNMVLEYGKHGLTIQAWGWYIRLLGQVILRNRNLLNEMLKVPEHTFQNLAPQVQTASLVAWQALVDVLIDTQMQLVGTELDNVLSALPRTGVHVDGLSKSTKLLMKPLLRIMSRRNNELSVYSSCFNTWRHLLHKLDLVINCSPISDTVFEPVLKVIFHNGLDNGNLWLWNSCVDLFDEFISSKFRACGSQASAGSIQSAILCEDYPIIKWLPWDFTKLDFHLKMIRAIIDRALKASVTVENSKLVFDAALKIFRSVLRGVHVDIKKPSTHFSEVRMCICATVEFVKELCEDLTSNLTGVGNIYLIISTVKFIWALREEFDPSILESPLYCISLDSKLVNNLKFDVDIPYLKILRISSLSFEHNVSPSLYLTILYHFMMSHSVLKSESGRVLDDMENCCKYVFSSSDPLENLLQVAYLLYLHGPKLKDCAFYFLKIWAVIARCLKQQINDVGNLNSLQTEVDHSGSLVVYWLLCYPFVMSQVLPTLLTKTDIQASCLISSESELVLSDALMVWKSLYDSADCALQLKEPTANIFAEDLCEMLLKLSLVDESDYECMSLNPCHLFVYAEIAMHIIEKTGLLIKRQASSNIKNCLRLTGRYLAISWTMVEAGQKLELSVVSRMFAALASFVGKLHSKEDILSLMEVISDPLVHWLSSFLSIEKDMQDGNLQHHFLILWTLMLDIMRRVQAPIIFDSLLLEAHAPLLLAALDHPCSSISDATIAFWNSTYGKQSKLNYPQNLLPVLDRLSRKGRVKLPKGSTGFTLSKPFDKDINLLKKHRVAAQTTRISSVEFVEEAQNDSSEPDLRKRLKLTMELQPKMDFGRPIHVVGVTVRQREECRSSDSILKMLRRTGILSTGKSCAIKISILLDVLSGSLPIHHQATKDLAVLWAPKVVRVFTNGTTISTSLHRNAKMDLSVQIVLQSTNNEGPTTGCLVLFTLILLFSDISPSYASNSRPHLIQSGLDAFSSSLFTKLPSSLSSPTRRTSLPAHIPPKISAVKIEDKPKEYPLPRRTSSSTGTTKSEAGLVNRGKSRFPDSVTEKADRKKKKNTTTTTTLTLTQPRRQSLSIPTLLCNAFDDIINNFVDPPIRPSVNPKYVLSDNFAPVDELPPTECMEVEGELPPCLDGAYIRNGPNPRYLPRGPYHLFDGDGMLHALRISGGRATLCSRYVRTFKYMAEEKAGCAVYPNVFSAFHGYAGIARGAVTAARALSGQFNPLQGVGLANTSLVFFANRLFALGESDLPYEVRLGSDGEICTVGRCDFEGKLFMGMTAHPKVDPDTGEVFAFRYGPVPPYLTYFRFDPAGVKQPDVPVFSLGRPSMIHDFAVTKRHAVFVDMQIVMNPLEMIVGNGSPVGADPRKVSRIGILPRYAEDESEMRWFEVPGFNMMHAVNAWDEEDEGGGGEAVVLVAPNLISVEHTLERLHLLHCSVEKIRIDLKTGLVKRTPVAADNLEFGVINPSYAGKRNRYAYMAAGDPLPKASGLVKLDLETGRGDCVVARREYGEGCYGGEPFFVARDPDEAEAAEDDGYVVSYVHDGGKAGGGESRFVVMDARSPTLEVVASVKLPARVPFGFHGLFVPERDLAEQLYW